MQSINDIQTEAVIGESYIVSILNAVYKGHVKIKVPIIDIFGSDGFGSKEDHYHIDVRFLRGDDDFLYKNIYLNWLEKRESLGNAITLNKSNMSDIFVINEPRECLRKYGPEYQPLPLEFQKELSYLDSSIMKCNVCPHRGYNLNQAATSNHGEVLVCPMHGTRWYKSSGIRYNKFDRKRRN